MVRNERKARLPSVRRGAGESLREKHEAVVDEHLPSIVFLPFVFMSGFQIRFVTIADAEVIGWHRARMFQDMGMVPDDLFDSLRAKSAEWVRTALASGEYTGWLVPHPEHTENIIAGAGVVLQEIPPIPLLRASGETISYDKGQALIVNVFTEPGWRRRGLARLLMERIIEWCHEQDIESVVLHSSEDGRALYEQLGFIQTSEMRLAG
jgi:GNAT superfamily N-acetyltransferase